MVALESARVLLSGSSGLLGTALSASLKARGFNVTRLVRGRVSSEDQIHWDPMRPPNADSLSGFDAIIHLAGETVVGRWTAAKKAKKGKGQKERKRKIVSESEEETSSLGDLNDFSDSDIEILDCIKIAD